MGANCERSAAALRYTTSELGRVRLSYSDVVKHTAGLVPGHVGDASEWYCREAMKAGVHKVVCEPTNRGDVKRNATDVCVARGSLTLISFQVAPESNVMRRHTREVDE